MNIALKEWAGIVEALRTGRQILLLRKGGIIEAAREGFVLKHREFLLFPTFEHQHRAAIRPEFHQLVTEPDPDRIPIRLLVQLTDDGCTRPPRYLPTEMLFFKNLISKTRSNTFAKV